MALTKLRSGPLQSVNFRWLLLSWATSALGDGFAGFALIFLVLDSGGNAASAGVVAATAQLPGLVLPLFGGVWADRFDRMRLMILSDIGRAVCQAVLFLLFWTGVAVWWDVALFGFLTSALGSPYGPSATGVIPQVVTDRQLASANGLLYTSRTGALACGIAAGGTVIAMFGPSAAIAVNALSFALSALFLSTVRLSSSKLSADDVRTAQQGVWRSLKEGWTEVRNRSWLLSELLRSAVEMPLVVAPFAIIGPLIAHTLGGAQSWATVNIGFMCGSMCGPFAVRFWKPRRPIWACTALMFLGAFPPLLLALTTSVPLITLAEGIKGAVVGYFGTIWAALLQREISDTVRSRVSAWDYTLTSGLTPIGYVLAGLMITQFGPQSVLLLGVACNIVGVTVVLMIPGVRRFRVDWNAPQAAEPPLPDHDNKAEAEEVIGLCPARADRRSGSPYVYCSAGQSERVSGVEPDSTPGSASGSTAC